MPSVAALEGRPGSGKTTVLEVLAADPTFCDLGEFSPGYRKRRPPTGSTRAWLLNDLGRAIAGQVACWRGVTWSAMERSSLSTLAYELTERGQSAYRDLPVGFRVAFRAYFRLVRTLFYLRVDPMTAHGRRVAVPWGLFEDADQTARLEAAVEELLAEARRIGVNVIILDVDELTPEAVASQLLIHMRRGLP